MIDCVLMLVGFSGVLPSDGEMKPHSSSLLNGSSVVGRPPPAPVSLPHQYAYQQQIQQLHQRGVSLSRTLSILTTGLHDIQIRRLS